MIELCLLGCGGVMPLPERALTSLFVSYNGKALLIDCGEGTQTVLKKHKLKYNRIDAILLTHLHGDHICGIAGLLLTFGLAERDRPLKIYGPKGTANMLNAIETIAPGLPFEVICEELLEESFELSEIGLKINSFPVKHSTPCLGYRFELERMPKFDVNKAQSLGIPVSFWGALQRGENAFGFEPRDVMGENRKGITFLYSTDTRPVEAITHYGKDSDLMILEGMYGESEAEEKAEETSHMTMCEAAEMAKQANTKALWLTHYSPSVSNPSEYEAVVKSIFPNTTFGYDGLLQKLNFD